jgi:hypothetical protein
MVQDRNRGGRKKLAVNGETGVPPVTGNYSGNLLRRRSLYTGWSGLFQIGNPARGNQLIQVIPVGPIRAESLFIEQPLGATAQTYLVRVALAPHRPTHPTMPAPAKRHQHHSSQARCHHPNWPEPPVFRRFFAPFRVFRHHSSQGSNNSQHRPDYGAGQTQEGRTFLFPFLRLFGGRLPKVQSALYQWTLRYMPEDHYPCYSGSWIRRSREPKAAIC